ncbi:hypothetical protein P9112_002682 [Eukaryota sp. TZLM1-RC]
MTISSESLFQHLDFISKFSTHLPSFFLQTVTHPQFEHNIDPKSPNPHLASYSHNAEGVQPPIDELKERLRQRIEQSRRAKEGQPEETPNRRKRRATTLKKKPSKKKDPATPARKCARQEEIDVAFNITPLTPTNTPKISGSLKAKKKLLGQLEKEKQFINQLPAETAVPLEQEKSWSNALSRAQGVNVLDDTAKLRKSIKQEENKKNRSKKQWDQRIKQQQEQQKQRQEQRAANIEARKVGKKTKTSAKRPGFEGKRQKAITGKKKK